MTPLLAAQTAWRGCHVLSMLHVLQGSGMFGLRKVLKQAIIGEAVGSAPEWDNIVAHFVERNQQFPDGHPHKVVARKLRKAIRQVRAACANNKESA